MVQKNYSSLFFKPRPTFTKYHPSPKNIDVDRMHVVSFLTGPFLFLSFKLWRIVGENLF